MKKIFTILLSFSFIFSSMFILSGCKKKNEQQPHTLTSFQIGYMSDLMIDIDEVTAFSIKQNNDSQANTVSNVSFTASLVKDNHDKSKNNKKNYLYSTTETYEYGNVEYNENSISKVTFRKNTSINKDVYDNDGNLITSETQVTQNDIDSQINKIYTTMQYTFIQFVACVESSGNYNYLDSNGEVKTEYVTLRPDSLTYDENGVADFDKTDYFSGNLTASFVIDNSTGYIYKIENLHIKSFKNGLVVDNNGYLYRLTIDSNSNLIFTDIMPNKEVRIYNAVCDNYGWLYINNDKFNSKDEINKIIYFTGISDYVFDNKNNVYKYTRDHYYVAVRISYTDGTSSSPEDFDSSKTVKGQEVKDATKFYLDYMMVNGNVQQFTNTDFIKDIKMLDVSENSLFCEAMWNGFYLSSEGMYHKRIEEGTSFILDSALNLYFAEDNATWLDKNYNFSILQKDGILYYKKINLDNYTSGNTRYKLSDYTIVENSKSNLEKYNGDYYLNVGKDKIKLLNVYKYIDINTTSYYCIEQNGDALKLTQIENKEYSQNTFIFQPINK